MEKAIEKTKAVPVSNNYSNEASRKQLKNSSRFTNFNQNNTELPLRALSHVLYKLQVTQVPQ